MNQETEVEELIKEIATKHGIAVGRDDPILILQTINNRLMQDSQKAQQEMLDLFKSNARSVPRRILNCQEGRCVRFDNGVSLLGILLRRVKE